uniref:Large ribosomal subunit protein uL10m n=1 Tax=Ditylenchus dipsaci TaxID=166011 RepID=A0A915EGP7_9BILA
MLQRLVKSQFEMLLKIASSSICSCRSVSHNYALPHPRHYRRRIYEAAVAPVFAPDVQEEVDILVENEAFAIPPSGKQARDSFDQYEKAEVKMIKDWIKFNEFRVLGVCQILHVKGPSFWMAANQFRLNDLHLTKYKLRTVHNLFRGTPFETLSILFDEHTSILYGKDINCLKVMVKECSKYNWLTLMAVTCDDRILSMRDVETLCKLHDLEQLRAETTQILSQIQNELVTNLDSTSRQLVKTFEFMTSKN